MPFTLSHPAAVLPLLRGPFVPSALVAGSVAPDVPYFLTALGLSASGAEDWYEPFLNATGTHAFGAGLLVSLGFSVGLVAVYRMVRAPITALLPSGLGLPGPERPTGLPARARYVLWLLVSALVGVASHGLWDAFVGGDFLVFRVEAFQDPALGGLSFARLSQYASTALGLAAVGWCLWRRRGRSRAGGGAVVRLRPLARWGVVAALVVAPVLGGAVGARGDFDAHRHAEVVDHSRPITVDLGGGASETTYPSTMVPAPWGTVAEGVSTGVAKRAGACFAVVLLLYAAAWQFGAVPRRRAAGAVPSPVPASGEERR
ncbi:DUF4184 family protein [Streptomyces sp. BBFR102]|uniref:DUF4184 family protein n=1 Tax=Streptomyces sp. BBFR102 TaxID=3448171 RepID=UPI003F52996D